MEKEYTLEELTNLTDEKIELGEKLIKDLSNLEKIDGVPKLQRKINQELKFFKKVIHKIYPKNPQKKLI